MRDGCSLDVLVRSLQHPLFKADATSVGLGLERRLLLRRKIERNVHPNPLIHIGALYVIAASMSLKTALPRNRTAAGGELTANRTKYANAEPARGQRPDPSKAF